MFSLMVLKFRTLSTTIIMVDLVKYVEALYTNSHIVFQTSVTLVIFYILMQFTERARGFCCASDNLCVSFITTSILEVYWPVKGWPYV
jgi:hypothetical protein